jgi:hypothetical protein
VCRHEGRRKRGDMAPNFLNLDARWRWLATNTAHFTPREVDLITHWIGRWVDHVASLDIMKVKIACPVGSQIKIPGRSSPQPSHWTALWQQCNIVTAVETLHSPPDTAGQWRRKA